MAIQGSYQGMLDYARRTGQAGTIDPISVAGFGTGGTYEFTPVAGSSTSYAKSKNIGTITQMYQAMEEEAKKKNLAREKEIRKLYANMLNSLTGSNNSLRASGLADIETESARLVGSETQQMISSGLYGTTTAGAIPRKVATGFTQPSRLKLEDLISSRKRELQLGLAEFVERIENPYPDYNSLMQAMIASRQ